jgi:hypothetical protein
MVPLLVLFGAFWYDKKRRENRIQAPQTEKLLRPPGYSLSIRLDALADRVINKAFVTCGLCAISGTFLGTAGRLYGIWCGSILLLGLAFGFAGGITAVRVFADLRRVRNIRLGLRGEQAVAEALQEVADCGYRVFHDFPGGDDWNIDHIVVGPMGIFLIETKARSRVRTHGNKQPSHIVNVIGDTLRFPTADNSKAIRQAERNARWLADYLTKKTGEKVEVEALVVLPGWFVKIQDPSRKGPGVMNADYLTKYLRGRSRKVELAQVRRIVAAVDEKCRDIEF